MGTDQGSFDVASGVPGSPARGLRAFGLLRRHGAAELEPDPGAADPPPELRFSTDPEVARRIAEYLGRAFDEADPGGPASE
jgi:hypothetical protein